MKPVNRLGAASVLAAALLVALAGPVLADPVLADPVLADVAPTAAAGSGPARSAVFVQTDNTVGNEIVAYHRDNAGRLTEAAAYPTGGRGGILAGSVVDHLASQGSLALDEPVGLLIAVNAGSNSISVFGVHGDRLGLRQVLSSGGAFPVSVAIRGDLAYVLNAEDGGSVQGYRIGFGGLLPLPGSARALGLDPAATPQYTTTPGQVAFSPAGSQLIVTTKANGNDIDIFKVDPAGYLSAAPVVNTEPGTVPFAITYDAAGHLVIAEAGTNELATFELHATGTVAELAAAGDAQSATCWVTADGSDRAVSALAGRPGRLSRSTHEHALVLACPPDRARRTVPAGPCPSGAIRPRVLLSDQMNSARSRSSADFGLAPTISLTT
ncbi:MAG TPA: hypothetical protein VK802_18285 [Streptosporangiaceae bacterium]|nr:hypothetical protein [Streptosporangiaceae bacterium]